MSIPPISSKSRRTVNAYLNGILPLGEVDLPLPLPLGDPRGLVLGHAATQGAGELRAEVEREVFLVLVEQTQLGALVGVDDGEDTGDRLADVAAVRLDGSVSLFLMLDACLMRFFPSPLDLDPSQNTPQVRSEKKKRDRKRTSSETWTKHRRRSSGRGACSTRSSIRPAAC